MVKRNVRHGGLSSAMTDQQEHNPPPLSNQSKGVGRDDRNMAVAAHLAPLLGFVFPGFSVLTPLGIWLLKRNESGYVEHHAREALNFQLSIALVILLWVILKLMLVGFLLLPLIPLAVVFVLILMVRAAIKAGNSEYYCYPFILRLVK